MSCKLTRAVPARLWTCASCRSPPRRTFTVTMRNDMPRRITRRSPSRVQSTSSTPLPTFASDVYEDLVTEEPEEPVKEVVETRAPKKKPSKWDAATRKDGKMGKLSIPDELLEEEEGLEDMDPPSRTLPGQTDSLTPQDSKDLQKPMSELPWYLNMEPQTRDLDPDHPMAARQKLPELPTYPPKLLLPVLEHLSVDIGLDYLTILDLRALDPPAALGANLIMVIGTARSEKHLHVSADRFCRWLRTEHKMRPYADGLLGRNELKLKIRRKNRKAKLLANVGATSTTSEEFDDGIRTGWVCVHAGQVEPAENAERRPQRPIEGFVGFGEETDKVTLVMQMFTEEKRAEIDLEALWGDLLERNLRKQKHREAEQGSEDVVGVDAEELTGEEKEARKRFKLKAQFLEGEDIPTVEDARAG